MAKKDYAVESELTKVRFEFRVDPELARRLAEIIDAEHTSDVERCFSPRPKSQILEAVLRAGADWFKARERLRENLQRTPPADNPQKPSRPRLS